MSAAERNRQIKKVLTQAFGPGRVSVRGSRGTAYGWVSVNIDWTPRDTEQRREMEGEIWKLFGAAGISIGTYGYDDPGSDYGYGSKISFNFNQPKYFRTVKHEDGSMCVQREHMGEWETVRAGG